MNDKYLITEIKNYMLNPLKYAVLMTGSWGSGKTYFVKNCMREIEHYYFSLNGVSNIGNLVSQIGYKLIIDGINNSNNSRLRSLSKIKFLNSEKTDKLGNASGMLISYLENKVNLSFDQFIKFFDGLHLSNEVLYIFDDLERCNIPIKEILGFINNLVEHNNAKVLIIANEEEIKDENYLKIKEKLIYQTLKYEPNLNKLYEELSKKCPNEVMDNKDFVIQEFKRVDHYNIRTLQFIFQRYNELNKKLNIILKKIEISSIMKKDLYNSIFKYFVVAARDYKTGCDRSDFKDDVEIGSYLLVDNSFNSITSFKFVLDYIHGNKINETYIKEVLVKYISNLNSEVYNPISSLSIINNWWESEDDEIERCTVKILEELKENKFSIDLYHKILLYLVRIVKIGFSRDYLNAAFECMISNINNSTSVIHPDYKIIDGNIDKEVFPEYDKLKNRLTEAIKQHNSSINKSEIDLLQEQVEGEIGRYIYDWYSNHKSDFSKKQGFINDFGIPNVLFIINNGNAFDIRSLIYLFNEIYSFSNVKEFYSDDLVTLKEIFVLLSNNDTSKYSKMKLFSYNGFIDVLKGVIKALE